MDDGQFFLGQRKRNRLLLGGVQGRVEEGRRPCGRGDRVRLALWTLTSTGGRHLLGFQKVSLEQGQQTADQATPGLPPASKPVLLGPSHAASRPCLLAPAPARKA